MLEIAAGGLLISIVAFVFASLFNEALKMF